MLIFTVNPSICAANDDIIFKQNQENASSRIVMEEGKTYYLEIVGMSNGMLLYKQVDKLKHPHKTIIASYSYNLLYGTTTFVLVNPLAQKLNFVGSVKTSSQSAFYKFSDDVVDDKYTYEWGRNVLGIEISNFELVK